MRDITDRKAQDQAIQEARSEAEEANAAKGRFLATMSHELRTPLNAVIGFSEMLMNEGTMALDAQRRNDYARLINDSGQHLLSVVNLVLDMSKIESGNFVITPEPFAPAAVIRNCCELLTLKAREVGLDIVVDLPSDLPEIVADKRALKQMLLNLLSNAVKFTDRGGRVTVTGSIYETQIVISVADTGVGIGQDDLGRVGDPFFQARGSYNRPYDGTGLGLSIVKGLVGLHGGRMEIESRLGEGTQVTIRLPIDCENPGVVRKGGGLAVGATQNIAELPIVSSWSDLQVKKRA
jgi:cell cycle sensor histidine kinase DivJ